MRATRDAPAPARIAGGTSIAISGASYALGIAYVVFFVVITVLMLIFAGAALKAMFEEMMNKYTR
ncbi:MAG: hypothetical protein L0177_08625 [Chloroflexi bacterium]|nr:hypothetical protein [Chloroflexota bacterium]